MIKLLLIFLFFSITAVLFFRTEFHRATRRTGMVLLLLAAVCFSLYAFDIVGVGLSEGIAELLGKVGEMA